MPKFRGRCQWEGCSHPDFESDRPAKYCSAAHKQAAYRSRNTRNVTPVTAGPSVPPPPPVVPSDDTAILLLTEAVRLLGELSVKLDRPVQFAGVMAAVAPAAPAAPAVLLPALELKVEQAGPGSGDSFDNFLDSLMGLEAYGE